MHNPGTTQMRLKRAQGPRICSMVGAACAQYPRTSAGSRTAQEFMFSLELCICDPSRHSQESPGTLGPKSKKKGESQEKRSFKMGVCRQKCPRKYLKKVSKYPQKESEMDIFRLLWAFSGTLLCRPSKRPFLRLCLRFRARRLL